MAFQSFQILVAKTRVVDHQLATGLRRHSALIVAAEGLHPEAFPIAPIGQFFVLHRHIHPQQKMESRVLLQHRQFFPEAAAIQGRQHPVTAGFVKLSHPV